MSEKKEHRYSLEAVSIFMVVVLTIEKALTKWRGGTLIDEVAVDTLLAVFSVMLTLGAVTLFRFIFLTKRGQE